MHPRTREVRRPEAGIDPRGSGSGQPPLLQGFLKHRKGGPSTPKASASSAPESKPKPATGAAKAKTASKASVAKAAPRATAAATTAAKPAPKSAKPAPKA